MIKSNVLLSYLPPLPLIPSLLSTHSIDIGNISEHSWKTDDTILADLLSLSSQNVKLDILQRAM